MTQAATTAATTTATTAATTAATTTTTDGGTPRVQLALDVDDLDTAVVSYPALRGTPPAEVRPGYADGERWEVCTVLADSAAFGTRPQTLVDAGQAPAVCGTAAAP